MTVFESMSKYDHEQVIFGCDKVSGLKAIIAIHNTTLGPALGGTRMWPYKTEEEALVDVLRLSRGMTYKNAAMGLNLGGGKAVIIGDSRKDKSEEMFRAFGKMVDSLGGRYITAEDVGTNTDDMETIRIQTPYVCGLEGTSGNPSPLTALGVFRAMAASIKTALGADGFKGLTVAVQGVGAVGFNLVQRLIEAGAKVYVTDIYPDKVKKAVLEGAQEVASDEIYDVECDVFAPCALGAVINDGTVPRLRCKIVCGSANNQLHEPKHGKALAERGILYAPDFIANGGGVTNVADELHPGGYNSSRAVAKINKIYDIQMKIFEIAKEKGVETSEAADLYAEERLHRALLQKRMYIPQ